MTAKPQDPRRSDEVDLDPASTTHESLGASEGGAAAVSHQPEAELLKISKENSMTEKTVNPEQEKCLVHGEMQGVLVFIRSQLAREVAGIHRAVDVSTTWGEFRTWIDPHRWEEILEQLEDGGAIDFDGFYAREVARNPQLSAGQAHTAYQQLPLGKRLPLDGDKFEECHLWDFIDVSFWPEWPLNAMLEWIPSTVRNQYTVIAWMDVEYLGIPPQDEGKVVAELERLGYRCVKNQLLVDWAHGGA